MESRHVVNLADVTIERINAPEGSMFGGLRQRVGARVGAQRLGYSFFNVPPGKAAFPYHSHTGNEEMIYILAGAGTLRLGKDELKVEPGTVVACLPGGGSPHQLINTGKEELRYLVVSTMEYPDISEYPDSKKIGVAGAPSQEAAIKGEGWIQFIALETSGVDYYEGEEVD